MAEEYPGVTSDSPADTSSTGATSAETLNTGTPAPAPQQHTIPYERFQQVNERGRHFEAQAAAYQREAEMYRQQHEATQQRLAQLESQLQERAGRVSRTPEEEAQRQQAQKALEDLQSDNPNWQRVLKLSKAAEPLTRAVLETRQELAQMRQNMMQSHTRGEEARLFHMAKAAGMSVDTPQAFHALNNYVAGLIRANPEALDAFLKGDASVLPRAFQIAKQHYDDNARAARAGLNQTKTQMQRLPPRPGGGTPGTTPSLPKFDPQNPDAIESQVFSGARKFMQERFQQQG